MDSHIQELHLIISPGSYPLMLQMCYSIWECILIEHDPKLPSLTPCGFLGSDGYNSDPQDRGAT